MSKDIEEIFEKHWKYYSQQSAETLKQQSGQIEQVTGDYQGRVLYELLQNAFDKAEKNILIQVDETYLYVANDEGRFTFTQNYDYKKGNSLRSDFQSLCSISTSTKNPSTSIGNKGVGFKSVYSLNSYADIFVKPKLLGEDEKILDEWIAFRVYDEIGKIQLNTIKKINKNAEYQLDWIVKEYPNRGIPGFYYPVIINDKLENFDELVTIIRVKHYNKIDNLIKELEKIHFYFIFLKYTKEIKVTIKTTTIQSTKNIKIDSIIGYTLKNEIINNLLKKITLSTQNPQVGLYYKTINDDYNDLIYNYMPTKVVSPFKMVDFQGDFQSTVDRKGIDLDNGDIANYNKALLRACIELHFITLSTYLDNEFYEFNLKHVKACDIKKVNFDKDGFWKYLQFNDTVAKDQTFKIVKDIFKNDWNNYGDFIAKLAKKYFDQKNLKQKNFDNFWIVYNWVIDEARYYQQEQDSIIKSFLNKIQDCCVVYIDEKSCTDLQSHIYYYENKNDVVLPANINVELIKYNDRYRLLKKVRYNSFGNFNSKYELLLKHFRQIPKNGQVPSKPSNYCFSEEAERQKEILKSLFQIYLAKNESNFATTHRYASVISDKTKDYTKIAADFAISTIFLEINNEKYRPAQYCFVDDVRSFIKFKIPKDKEDKKSIDDFLKFLGVSFDSNIRYTDFENKELFDDWGYIPLLYTNEDEDEKDTTPYIKNMKIYYRSNNNDFEYRHPALFYKTTAYSPILTEIKSTKIEDKESLPLVVKGLKDYPTGYIKEILSMLREPISFDETTVFKIYSTIFKKYDKKYLIYNKNCDFEWKKEDSFKDVVIAKTKKDFELLKDKKIDILATFSDVSEDNKLKLYQAKIKYKIAQKEKTEDIQIKIDLETKIIDILLLVSQSNLSEYDFREDEYNEKLKEFNSKWIDLSFYILSEINPKIILKDIEIGEEKISYPISINKKVYFTANHKLSDFADMLSDFFNINKLKDSIKLILLDEKQDFNREDIGIITSKWLRIDETKQQSILKKLKSIGFKQDTTFKLKYTQDDFDFINCKNKTEDDIQRLINRILFEEQLEKNIIQFDCKTKNKILIDKIRNKYSEILDLSSINGKDMLLRQVCLSNDDVFSSIGEREKDLDIKLEALLNENLTKDYNLDCDVPKKDTGKPQDTNNHNLQTSSVYKNEKQEKVESNRMAKKRGLKIEVLLVQKLAKEYENNKYIKEIATDIFTKMKQEKLPNGEKRFKLEPEKKNVKEYEKILENGSLEEILHISKNLGDGVGFDILFPLEENGNLKLLKVEVKSSEKGETIYLTENERKQILLYKENNDNKIDEDFRVYLYIKKQDPKNITENVFTVLENNNNFSNIKAETWILNINTKEATK